jgi:hopanoid biosynthesis associated protein HpnK
MVAGEAAADAVRRARAMPGLAVGLHLVVIEGPAVCPPPGIPALVDGNGMFPSHQLGLGVRYFTRPDVRRQLAAEIAAQFAAFRETGLPLDHADAHKHMHLHPTVGAMLIGIGRRFGLRAIRVPAEPPRTLAACGVAPTSGARLLHRWSSLLRWRARRAGMALNDAVFGLTWSGAMTEERVLELIPHLPEGVSEIYFHPAVGRDALLTALMPLYRHEDELAALVSPRVRFALGPIERTTYGALVAEMAA